MTNRRMFLGFMALGGGSWLRPALGAAARRRVAVVYFSKTGHTRSLAESVRHFTGADLYQVETKKPYPADYTPTTKIVKEEMEKGIVGEIKPFAFDLSRYDVIVLATPTWWHHVSAPLQTWIRGQKLAGRFVLTANTHGGGGLMHTREDFEKLLAGSRFGTHLTVFGAVSETSPKFRAGSRATA